MTDARTRRRALAARRLGVAYTPPSGTPVRLGPRRRSSGVAYTADASAPVDPGDALLLPSGDYILLPTGDKILLSG